MTVNRPDGRKNVTGRRDDKLQFDKIVSTLLLFQAEVQVICLLSILFSVCFFVLMFSLKFIKLKSLDCIPDSLGKKYCLSIH